MISDVLILYGTFSDWDVLALGCLVMGCFMIGTFSDRKFCDGTFSDGMFCMISSYFCLLLVEIWTIIIPFHFLMAHFTSKVLDFHVLNLCQGRVGHSPSGNNSSPGSGPCVNGVSVRPGTTALQDLVLE